MPSRRRVLTALSAAGVTGVAGCAALGESAYDPGGDDATEWPMPAYDPGFSAYSPDAGAPRRGVTGRWSTEIPTPSARPVVAAGTVLVPTRAGLVALALDTGEERWRHGRDDPWPSAPVVHDGTAYVGFADRPGLVALSLDTGAVEWRAGTDGAVQASPTFGLGRDPLYAGDDTGRVYRVDPATGEVTLRGEVFGPVTALAFHDSLLVGTESGEAYDLLAHRGEFTGLWRRSLAGSVSALAVAPGGHIFVATFGGPVYRLRDGARVGTTRWKASTGARRLAATGGDVVGSDGAGLRTFDARTGERGWARDVRLGAAPAVAGDTVYVGGGERGDDGTGFVAAYALDGGTLLGNRRWRFDVDSSVSGGLAVADGAVVAVAEGGTEAAPRVHVLDPA